MPAKVWTVAARVAGLESSAKITKKQAVIVAKQHQPDIPDDGFDWVERYRAEWDKVRKLVLKRDGHLCQCKHCEAEGRTTIAAEVDHIVSRAIAQGLGWSNARTEHPDNLQAINSDCHVIKTQEEQGKTVKPKRHIGLDGFPIV